jgi:hypothetical protein
MLSVLVLNTATLNVVMPSLDILSVAKLKVHMLSVVY